MVGKVGGMLVDGGMSRWQDGGITGWWDGKMTGWWACGMAGWRDGEKIGLSNDVILR